jgi:hypothetical protein
MALDLNDKTANGNNLTNHGATEYTADTPFTESTEAVRLVRASNQYLSAPNSSSLNIVGDMTLEAWIKPASVPASDNVTHTIISKYNDDSTAHQAWIFGLFYKPGVGLGISLLIFKDGTTFETFFEPYAFFTDSWIHVAAVFTAASKQVEFFINGSSIGVYTDDLVDAIQSTTTEVEIGGFRNGEVENFDGCIDEVRIWNTTRSAAQLLASVIHEIGDSGTGMPLTLVAYWPFESMLRNPSLSPSSSISASISPSASVSPSASQSPSASLSPSSSTSPSLSPSASQSPSASLSPSASISPSISPSASQSPSSSVSSSTSPSISPSASLSPSASRSPSASLSPSASSSRSQSPSSSLSASISPSASASASRSPSASSSASFSPSPSQGYAMFTRGDEVSLPIDTSDLETVYSYAEELAVEKRDDTYIDQTGMLQYMIHQFKVFVGSADMCQVEWEGKSTLAPRLSTVYLQIFNYNTHSWETVDTETQAEANVDFELEKKVRDTTNYRDAQNLISARIYQLAT